MLPFAWGTVENDGTILSGSGNFTVNKTATGIYEISVTGLSNVMESEASIIANPGYNATATFIRSYVHPTNHKFYVKTQNSSGNAENEFFNFLIFKQ
jgi:hypothetical protein